MIHLAIDHGKKVSHAVALTDLGEVLFDAQIPTTLEGLASVKEALPADEPVHSIVEAARRLAIKRTCCAIASGSCACR